MTKKLKFPPIQRFAIPQNMKKIIYTLFSIAIVLVTSSAVPNATFKVNIQTEVVSPQMSTTEIFDYLNTNLGLTSTQKSVVKKVVDETGVETTKLNADSSKSAAEVTTAKTSLVNILVKKLSSGVLSEVQSKKLAGLTGTLTTMFAQLK